MTIKTVEELAQAKRKAKALIQQNLTKFQLDSEIKRDVSGILDANLQANCMPEEYHPKQAQN